MNAVAEAPVTEDVPAPFVFTDSAADKVKQLIEEEGNADLKLRVFVQGGGCSASSTASPSMKTSTKTTPRWSRTASRC
jgi:Fe-S cluster assembly iron-binding protein IscA